MSSWKRFGVTACAVAAALSLVAPAAGAVAPGTYSGTTQQGKPFSLTVDGTGHVTGWSLGFTCGASTGTVQTTTSCTPSGSTFSCGTASCIPYAAMARVAGTFSGISVSGTFDLAQQADAISSCCHQNGLTFSASLPGPPPCAPGDTTLCLDDQADDRRFKVEVAFATTQGGGRSGDGHAVSLASLGITQGGLFWFFEARNPELLIKVLNGCTLNGKYWIFFSAGTNVGLTIHVDDTAASQEKIYTNTDGHAVATVQDTTALPCS